MSTNASYARSIAHGTALIAAILYSLAACKSQEPAPLPMLPPLPDLGHKVAAKKGSYRNQSGSPIAPSVVPDDPAPTQVQVAAADNPTGAKTTLNGDPNGITRDTLHLAVQGAMGSLAACFSSLTEDPMVSVSFEADPSGRPSLVRVGGAPPDAERCIRNVVQNIHFPSFEGKGVQVDLPLSFHRVARPPQPAAPSGQPPPGAPLFLQP